MKIKCHNCGEDMTVNFRKNRWTESFQGECETCGWKFLLKDKDFDYIQPDSPFFELIYKYSPDKIVKENKVAYEKQKEAKKAKLQEKYWKERRDPLQSHTNQRAEERRAIEKIVLEED